MWTYRSTVTFKDITETIFFVFLCILLGCRIAVMLTMWNRGRWWHIDISGLGCAAKQTFCSLHVLRDTLCIPGSSAGSSTSDTCVQSGCIQPTMFRRCGERDIGNVVSSLHYVLLLTLNTWIENGQLGRMNAREERSCNLLSCGSDCVDDWIILRARLSPLFIRSFVILCSSQSVIVAYCGWYTLASNVCNLPVQRGFRDVVFDKAVPAQLQSVDATNTTQPARKYMNNAW